jgi:hypothetical protein
MVRLLERASFRRNDPDLFAGLVQACRYCDELGASMAAHERGCHLDPNLVTSATHTYFLLGDYAKSLDCYGNKVGYYLDCAALAALGDDKAALAKLREREHRGGATGAVQAIMRSLRAYLEGDFAECVQAIELGEPLTRRDPETLYYMARHLARVNEPERAITMLTRALEGGFLYATAIMRDPWFVLLRSSVHYVELMRQAERKRNELHATFLAAGGEKLLNV